MDQDSGGPKTHGSDRSRSGSATLEKSIDFYGTYSQDDAEEAVEAEEEAKRWSGQGGQVAFSYEEPLRGQQSSVVPEATDLPTEDRYLVRYHISFQSLYGRSLTSDLRTAKMQRKCLRFFIGLIFRMDEDGEAFVPGPELRLPEDLVLPPTNKLFSVILKVPGYNSKASIPGSELRLPEDLVLPPTNKLFSVILKVPVYNNSKASIPGSELRLPEDLVLSPTSKLFSVILKVPVYNSEASSWF
jgi:hypothetical protein